MITFYNAATLGLIIALNGVVYCAQTQTSTTISSETTQTEQVKTNGGLVPCDDLPRGDLTDAQLQELVPDNSAGSVRIAWKTESQEETYGFNIQRADKPDGPYAAVNKRIIPGEGTSNLPKDYCFEDTGVKRGQTYYYQIQEITNAGERTIIEGTAATKIKVKTVTEERDWLKKRALKTK